MFEACSSVAMLSTLSANIRMVRSKRWLELMSNVPMSLRRFALSFELKAYDH